MQPADDNSPSRTSSECRYHDAVAVVTGAGSGIGRSLSLQLAQRGAKLAINDYSAERLSETQAEIERAGGVVLGKAFDVGAVDEMRRFADEVHDRYGRVDVLINNAGVALGQINLDAVSLADFEWIINTNLWGVVHGTMAFLPLLRQQPTAHLVNVSSAFGLLAVPGQSPYCAAKFAVRGFTDSLRLELLDTNVAVTLVIPSHVKTNIMRHGRHKDEADKARMVEWFDKETAYITPDDTARRILDGVARKRRQIKIGGDSHYFDLAARYLPAAVIEWLTRWQLSRMKTDAASATT